MKYIITLAGVITAVFIYELVCIYFDLSGMNRTLGAGLSGLVGVLAGKYIGEHVERKQKK